MNAVRQTTIPFSTTIAHILQTMRLKGHSVWEIIFKKILFEERIMGCGLATVLKIPSSEM